MMKLSLIMLTTCVGLISCAFPHFFMGRPTTRWGMTGHLIQDEESSAELAQEYWFDQRLDHFDPTNTKTWRQRYHFNTTHHKPGGPVFLMLGGEGELIPIFLESNQMATNYAKRYNAMTVTLEHRYYGKSHPTEDMSTENLRYLTTENALHDAAYFIEYFSKNMSLTDNKWIVFGVSYSGALAAWFREKYPHLVAGAVASSGPVQPVVDNTFYLDVVAQSLGPKCSQHFLEASDQLAIELSQPASWPLIEKQFKLCSTLNGSDHKDVSFLFQNLMSSIERTVQYNKGTQGDLTTDSLCDIMANTSMTPLKRWAEFNQVSMNKYNLPCTSCHYSDYIEVLKNTTYRYMGGPIGVRQWTYQTCSQLGFFITTDQKDLPFGHFMPVEWFFQQCSDIFGPEFNRQLIEKSVDNTNNMYGGRNIKASKIVFANGSIDPWHALSVTKGDNSTVILIEGTAHGVDMHPDQLDDPQALKDARLAIEKAIGVFLAD